MKDVSTYPPAHLARPQLLLPRWATARLAFWLLASLFVFSSARASTLPARFSETRLATGLDPTSLSFAPDGRLFVTIKSGSVRIIKNGALLGTPFLTIANVDATNERGLQKLAFDPNFATNQFVYVYYTVGGSPAHNRVSRFTANGDAVVAGSEQVLLELNNLGAGNHNGGALFFKGGKLYITTGENTVSSNSQSLTTLLGKVLRINPDGSIPTDNPFYTTATGNNRAIWALGLRNPFRAAVQPGTGRIFINDVGASTWEEINDATAAGKNFGWPGIEGTRTTQTPPANYQDPVYAYDHSQGCAITGGTFFNPTSSAFPSSYTGKYFFADYCNGYLKTLDPANGNAIATFATGIDRPIDVQVGPDGNLYYLARGGLGGGSVGDNTSSNGGEVWRVQYVGNDAPSISAQPVSATTAAGAAVTFVVGASGGAPLAYQWQRNGTAIAGATAARYTLAAPTPADNGATFRVVVSNAVSSVTSNSATLTVTTNQAPVAGIVTPATGATYRGGDVINFSGTGTDAEDGALPASAYAWLVVFHHASHVHPGPVPAFPAAATTGPSGTFVVPAQGEAAANVWYTLILQVTDSKGAKSTEASVEIHPVTSTLSLATSPAGLQVTLDGQPLATPAAVLSVVGIERTLGVVTPQSLNGKSYEFVSWSQGGSATQAISTPAANATYTATFREVSAAGGIQSGAIYELAPLNAPGLRLDVLASGTANGTQINIAPRNGTPAQAWQLTNISGTIYELTPQNAGAAGSRLDVNGSSTANRAKVQLWNTNGSAAQRWKLLAIDAANAVYELEPQCAPGQRLNVDGSGTANGTKVQSYRANSTSAQRWKLTLKPALRPALAAAAPAAGTTPLEIYPNPATDQASFQYELGQPATVRLEVLNALGQRVELLVQDETQAAGRHQVAFAARALPAGTYRVVLTTGAAVVSKPLLLVR